MSTDLLPLESITHRILLLREQKVMLDADLALLYGVETRRLNEQVRRNLERFPDDFMFQISPQEWESLRSQIATLKTGREQHRKYMPYVFTEHGAMQAANVLNSPQAAKMAVYVVRAFVKLREVLRSHRELAQKLEELEQKTEALSLHHDIFAHNTRAQLKQVFEAIRELMEPPESPKKPSIGFVTPEERPTKPKAAKRK